jgi:two-component sensor histidine kinase
MVRGPVLADTASFQQVSEARAQPASEPPVAAELHRLQGELAAARAELAVAAERLRRTARDGSHGLKNALHFVASLLNLQGGTLAEGPVRREFESAIERVAVVGTIYGRLLDASAPRVAETLSARRLIGELCADLAAGQSGSVRLEVEAAELSLAPERALALGLIVRELVSNSLRHGFPDGRAGTVTVRLAKGRGRGWRLSVADDGIGLAPEAPGTGFGLKLVRLMVGQLRGTLERAGGSGTRHTIRFAADPAPAAALGPSGGRSGRATARRRRPIA